MSAPERIWAGVITDEYRGYTGAKIRVWGDDPRVGTDETAVEYIRADLLTAAQAEIARLTADLDAVKAARDTMGNLWAKAEAERDAAMAERAEPVAGAVTADFIRGVECAAKWLEEDHDCEGMASELRAYIKDFAAFVPTPQPTPSPQAREITVQEAAEVPCDFLALVFDAMAEADRAMRKFPQPNYVISKLAEEAGETVKAAIHYAEGRETRDAVVGEMLQTIAMMLRLWIEGDEVHGMPALRALAAMQKGG